MRKPESVKALETLGRERLSKSFFMRDFLYSEVANFYRLPNIPENPDLAIANGKRLCEELLEPLQATFGRITICSGYRAPEVNRVCNEEKLGCAQNKNNFARHIWDIPNKAGSGAMACIVVNWYSDRYEQTGEWQPLAWWIHDHLPYSSMEFFPKLCAFNLGWHEEPKKQIYSYVDPKGWLENDKTENHEVTHSEWYSGFPPLQALS